MSDVTVTKPVLDASEVRPMVADMVAAKAELAAQPAEHVFEAAFEAGWIAHRERWAEMYLKERA